MTETTVSAYSDAASHLPDEYFLGQIVVFTISDVDVNLDTMRQELTNRNLRTQTLTKRLRAIDAFKKAAADIATKFPRNVAGEQHNLLVRPVGQDSTECHRHIVFERAIYRVGQKRRVEHETIWKLMYDRGTRLRDGTIVDDQVYAEPQFVPGLTLAASEQEWLDQIIGEDGKNFIERFEHYKTHLDSSGVRSFVREYLRLLGGVNVKGNGGGATYFVQQKHAEELRDLMEFVKSIGSYMHLIPLLDIVDQREMLAEAFVQDTMDEVRAMSVQVGKILTEGRQITEATFDDWAGKAIGLIQKADDYQKMLDRNLDTTHLELQIFKQKVLSLSTCIRRPKSLGSGGKK